METRNNIALIVDSNYLKTNYPGYVESNIDDNSLESFIILAQDTQLQSAIGYTMYRKIMDTLISDPTGNSFSSQYTYIIQNYIMPEVALWAIYLAYPTLLYKPTNKAIVTKHSDESNPVGIRELEYLRSQIKSNAEFYDSRIVEYIKNYTNDFIEYYTTSGVNRIRPKSNLYFGGIYLKPSYGRPPGGCCIDRGYNLNW